jgi:transketolase
MNNLNKDIRDIFFENVKNNFLKNKKNYILTNDADVFALKKIKNNQRFIDAGVAEQNLINIASGLAKYKKFPLVYGFCTFLTFRCYEQLRFNVASHNLNIKIIGIGPGYSFPYDGPTHHGTQDLYLMYLIPEFEIYNISGNNLANVVSKNLSSMKGPVYIRLDKGVLNYNQNIIYDLKKGFEITVKNKNSNKLLITTGIFNKTANELAIKNKDFDVINLFKLKNFNKIKFINICKKYKKLIVYDENTISGGILPIIQQILTEYDVKNELIFLCSPDKQLFKYSQSRESILEVLGLTKNHLNKIILKNK